MFEISILYLQNMARVYFSQNTSPAVHGQRPEQFWHKVQPCASVEAKRNR